MRTPLRRSMFENSTIRSSIIYLMEEILIALDARSLGGMKLGFPFGDVGLHLLLGLADIPFVFHKSGEGLLHQFLVQSLDIEEGQCLHPIERLADAGRSEERRVGKECRSRW